MSSDVGCIDYAGVRGRRLSDSCVHQTLPGVGRGGDPETRGLAPAFFLPSIPLLVTSAR